MRGEDQKWHQLLQKKTETPPRAWGRQTRTHCEISAARNTPTCVGKTQRSRWQLTCTRKHPHVRGEDPRRLTQTATSIETPPRAWGRPNLTRSQINIIRNTPTCVGKTVASLICWSAIQKHPHVRGEDFRCWPALGKSLETPPRAWGRPTRLAKKQALVRNTPTCVGKTTDRRGWSRQPSETPPRAWGRQSHHQHPQQTRRNTPTCVGKTFSSYGSSVIKKKHPHVRGEDCRHPVGPRCGGETPPRAWGRPNGAGAVQVNRGNTPTCVGKTALITKIGNSTEKHPHVRGEDLWPPIC